MLEQTHRSTSDLTETLPGVQEDTPQSISRGSATRPKTKKTPDATRQNTAVQNTQLSYPKARAQLQETVRFSTFLEKKQRS